MKKQFTAFLLLVVMMFSLCLTACGGGDVTTQQTTTTEAPTTPTNPTATETLAAQLKAAGYKLIYPQYKTTAEDQAVRTIEQTYNLLTGELFNVTDDFVKKGKEIPANAKEILVGKTNRASSKALLASIRANRVNSSRDWQIVMKDKEILITAGDDAGLLLAANAFAALLRQKVSLESYDSGLQLHKWELETLGGKPVSDYRIVIAQNASRNVQTQASSLQTAIFDLSGCTLEIVTDETAATECEITVGQSTRPFAQSLLTKLSNLRNNNHRDYIIEGNGTKIGVLSGNDSLTITAAVSALKPLINKGQAQTISIEKTYQEAGLIDLTFADVPAGQFQIVIAEEATFAVRYGAQRLKKFITEATGYEIFVVSDTAPATAHEIVLGKTNRSQAALQEKQYHVTLKDGHFFIEAGHDYGISTALDELIGTYGESTTDIAITTAYNSQKTLAEIPEGGYLGEGATVLTFTMLSDLHYKTGMYIAGIKDMQEILDRANDSNSDFIIHGGDFCNDYIGSPELFEAYLNNNYDLPAYGIYGNHELESANNSMDKVTPLLTNRADEVVWGTADGKPAADGSIAYYYFETNGFRVICTDANYSWNPTKNQWEHNYTCSYGPPSGNTQGNSLGPVQLEWLEGVLNDAADKDIPCIIFSHDSFSGVWSSCSDAAQARALFNAANEKNPGTVLMAINGHLHTNRYKVIDGILYWDLNTVFNGVWRAETKHHYTSESFEMISYDNDGKEIKTETKLLSSLSMGAQTWFFQDPLSATVTITSTGQILVEGMESTWYGGVIPEGASQFEVPEISSGMFDLGLED